MNFVNCLNTIRINFHRKERNTVKIDNSAQFCQFKDSTLLFIVKLVMCNSFSEKYRYMVVGHKLKKAN